MTITGVRVGPKKSKIFHRKTLFIFGIYPDRVELGQRSWYCNLLWAGYQNGRGGEGEIFHTYRDRPRPTQPPTQ
jgi:hypothetical protein